MNKRIIIIFINLLIAIALVFVFVDPLWSSVKVLKLGLAKQSQDVSNVEELLAKIKKLEEDYQEIKENTGDISLALPSEKDTPYLTNEIKALASASGLLLESVEFGEKIRRIRDLELSSTKRRSGEPEKPLSPFPYLPVEMKLDGYYEGLRSYLSDLEKDIRLMDVISVNFKRQEGSEAADSFNSSIFKFNIKAIVYYQ